MQDIIDRLSSFLSCPDHILLPTQSLVESGFWYTGHEDVVECYHCQLRLRGCSSDSKNPAQTHAKYRPQCPVAQKMYQTLTQNNPSSIRNEDILPKQNTGKWSDPWQSIQDVYHSDQNTGPTTSVMQSPNQTRNFPPTYVQVPETEFSQSKEKVHLDNQQEALSKEPSAGISSHENYVLLERNACSKFNLSQTKRLLSNEHDQGSPPELGFKRPHECVNPAPYEPDLEIYEGNKDIHPETHTVVTTTVDYKVASNRMDTFKDWPSNAIISAEEAVEAGLYYTGDIDKVQCAWCKGGLYNWDQGDTAMGEHSRHFPQCPFVRQWQASQHTNTYQKHKHHAKNIEQDTGDNNTQPHKPNQGKLEDNTVIKKEQVDWHSFNAVQLVLQMGYEERMIETAVKKHHLTSSTMTNDLLDILFEMEHKSEENGTSPTTSSIPQQINPKPTTEDNTETELSLLMDENKRLKSSRTCTVCLEAEISVVFMPCRHLACCKSCSESLDKCPLCREPIVGTVKLPDSY